MFCCWNCQCSLSFLVGLIHTVFTPPVKGSFCLSWARRGSSNAFLGLRHQCSFLCARQSSPSLRASARRSRRASRLHASSGAGPQARACLKLLRRRRAAPRQEACVTRRRRAGGRGATDSASLRLRSVLSAPTLPCSQPRPRPPRRASLRTAPRTPTHRCASLRRGAGRRWPAQQRRRPRCRHHPRALSARASRLHRRPARCRSAMSASHSSRRSRSCPSRSQLTTRTPSRSRGRASRFAARPVWR